MKRILHFLALLSIGTCFSQSISVSSTSYTIPQLVNQVLINSTCVQATNITSKTGTHYNSSNGIGYFQNTNPNFPMQSGVVLSTGNAQHAASLNLSMLDDGDNSWEGDADLEHTLAQAGITMVSKNASMLEFDFTPISANFSFDFIFASEEYGNFQCQYSDAFAFLLTDSVTGITTNLAVVPNTSLPISVITIRDFLYNSSCPSANAQYFGRFNGGSASATSAMNFNGQTKILTAGSSSLVPNRTYHIKLVIADRGDFRSDSAIFISSNSLNIGQQVFGDDLTVAAGTAVCFGGNQVIETNLNPADYTFFWKRNGQIIAGATSASLTVTQPGNYSVFYKKTVSTCNPIEDDIVVEFYPEYVTPNAKNIYRCDTGAATYPYYLAYNTSIIKYGMNPVPAVSYFASAADALSNQNMLPLTFAGTPGQTIYVRVKNPVTQCVSVKTFQLLTVPTPTAPVISDLVKCETVAGTGTASFNLYNLAPTVLNGLQTTIFGVLFFNSLTDAQADANNIPTSNNFVTSTRTIYARVFNYMERSCGVIVPINFIVNPIPVVDQIQNVVACTQYMLPVLTHGSFFTGANGTGNQRFPGELITSNSTIYIYSQSTAGCKAQTSFTVTIITEQNLVPTSTKACGSYTLPTIPHAIFSSGPNGTGTVYPAGTVFTATETIYSSYTSLVEPVCNLTTTFTINVVNGNSVGAFNNVFDCSSYVLPTLPSGNYFTGSNGTGTSLAAGSTITQTQTVFVFTSVNQLNLHCSSEASFTVNIGYPAPADVTACQSYTLPALSVGYYFTAPNGGGQAITPGTVLTQSQTVYIYVPTSGGVSYPCITNTHFNVTINQTAVDHLTDVTTCDSYTLPVLTDGNYFSAAGGTGSQMTEGDVINTSRRIYIHSVSEQNCSSESFFNVTILPSPAIDSRSDIDVCNAYTLTNLTNGSYFSGINGTGNTIASGTTLTTTQTIWIYAVSNSTPVCTAQNNFTVTIHPVHAPVWSPVSICNQYVLPALPAGVAYYTATGGSNGAGVRKMAGDLITQSTVLYLRAETGDRIVCSDESIFNITIIQAPLMPAYTDQVACNQFTLPALTSGNYFTTTGGVGNALTAGTVLTETQTVYVFEQTTTTPSCTQERSFLVTIHQAHAPVMSGVQICNQFELPALPIDVHYFTMSNGGGQELTPGTVITASTALFLQAQSSTLAGCSNESNWGITIIPAPALPSFSNQEACNQFVLPVLNSGNYFTAAGGAGNSLTAGTVLTQTQTVYVFDQTTTTPSCSQERSFQVTINEAHAPVMTAVQVCNQFELPALPTNVHYYTATIGGQELPAGTILNTTTPVTIRAQSPTMQSCSDVSSWNIVIVQAPVLPNFANQAACNQYVLPVLNMGKYFTTAGGTGTNVAAGTIVTENQTIYVFDRTNTTPSCTQERSFTITIHTVQAPSVSPIQVCEQYILPSLPSNTKYYTLSGGGSVKNAGDVISQSTQLYVQAQSTDLPGCFAESVLPISIIQNPVIATIPNQEACGHYVLPNIQVGRFFSESQGAGSLLSSGTVLTQSQTVYVYAQTATTPACKQEKSFQVNIFSLPSVSDITTCGGYVLPTLATGTYFNGPNRTGGIIAVGTEIRVTKKIYVNAVSPSNASCSDEKSFMITVTRPAQIYAVPAPVRTSCDKDGSNDGLTQFDVNSFTSYVLGNQTGSDFQVRYFENATDANQGLHAISALTAANPVYVRMDYTPSLNCFDVQPIALIVHKLPEPKVADGYICVNPTSGNVEKAIITQTDLSATQHAFVWYSETQQVLASTPNFRIEREGTYEVVAKNAQTGCKSVPTSFTISNSSVAKVSYRVDDLIDNLNIITVVAQGKGTYEYSIDGGAYQESATFENVEGGVHIVRVRDINGCGIEIVTPMVVEFPKFFTPNGDGYNDVWNIESLTSKKDANIQIFDRFGKMIMQIKPNGSGWDGQLNGSQLPSDDYWFAVQFTHLGKSYEYKSHFTLKR
ncbi:MAG: hypothetical protein CFE24_00460 [Flavobacterium sp. BFFFF2]|nr:MAG: hypothetical protein CFE24_00460 [Flavobacterium sp. BFFFF2]